MIDLIQPDLGPVIQVEQNGNHGVTKDGEVLREGKKHDMGSTRLRYGSEYHGMFSMDSFCGIGKFYFEDGTWFEWIFDSGISPIIHSSGSISRLPLSTS